MSSKNPDCSGCFYQEVDPRDGPCNSCFATAKYVHKDVFKDVDDNPVFKRPADALRETFGVVDEDPWFTEKYGKYDNVDKPKHYMLFESEGIEVRDVIEKLVLKLKQADNCVPLWEKGALFEADYVQMMQYGMRFMDKNGKEDLLKMRWYLDKMIEAYE